MMWGYPSIRETFEAIGDESEVVTKHQMECDKGEKVEEAIKNLRALFKQMMDSLPEDIDRDAHLTEDILSDPKHTVPLMFLNMYSMETFLYKSLNDASRYGKRAKIDTLGPYAQCMNTIVQKAIGKRKNELNRRNFKNLNLYRGSCLTEE